MRLTADIISDVVKFRSVPYHQQLDAEKQLSAECKEAITLIEQGKLSIKDISTADIREAFIRMATKIEPQFSDDEHCGTVIDTLVKYIRDGGTKGILLRGPVGTGKTLLLTVFRDLTIYLSRFFLSDDTRICKHNASISLKPSYEIVSDFAKFGYEIFEPLMTNIYDYPVFIVDDLGSETQVNHYGSSTNPIAELILRRYDTFKKREYITHCSTNLGTKALQDKYGERIFSRMKEMFNVINLLGDDRRK